MRTHVPSSRTPAVHTVSPYFRESVGYVFTVMRTRSLVMSLQVLRLESVPNPAFHGLGHAVSMALLRQSFVAGERDALASANPFLDLGQGLPLQRQALPLV